MKLETILDNIDQYRDNIDDLVKVLKQVGIKSVEEFQNAAQEAGGVHGIKPILAQLADKFAKCEEEDWEEAVSMDSEEGYLNYLRNYTDGAHRAQARNRISCLQSPVVNEESDKVWNEVDKDDINQIKDFINNYSSSQYVGEAHIILRKLQKEEYLGVGMSALAKQISAIMADQDELRKDDAIFEKIANYIETNKISVNDLINAIKADHNFISGNVAYKLWSHNKIIVDFSKTGISEDFIGQMLSGVTPAKLDEASSLERITKVPSTEIYFWGIPSSGKSCAIGAILSAANNGNAAKSMMKDPNCQGYGYMNDLSDLFGLDGEVGILPERTQATLGTTYEMGFELQDEKGKVHPITCIDIAGEVFCDIHKLQSKGEDSLKSDVHEVLRTLNKILIDNRTSNRKIHFFVIEYRAEDRKYKGVPQGTYLQSAVAYINQTGIFKKDTDAVYILVTKADKANAVGNEQLREKLKSHISTKYLGFYNGLKRICEDNEINRGQVEILPFTLGDVCFQYYCRFNATTASKVVKTILTRSYGCRPKWKKIIDKFKS